MTVRITDAAMDVELADFMKETTQTIGTGAYALDGVSEDAMRSFVSGVGSGNKTVYSCVLGTSREVGIGTVTSGAPDTLSRDFILSSTNSDLLIDWGPGVKEIHGDVPAALLEQIISRDQTLDIQAGDNATALIVRNDDDTQVVQLRVTSGGDGAVTVRTADDTTTVQLRANQNSRGSLQLNDFEVYPLAEGLGSSTSVGTGTTHIFTNIRSDARLITITLLNVSLSGTDDLEVALRNSSSFEITGYTSLHQRFVGGTNTQGTGPDDAWVVGNGTSASGNYSGRITLTMLGSSSNTWVMDSILQQRGANVGTQISVGDKALSSTLTQIRLQSSGSNTFDGGSVNILVQ